MLPWWMIISESSQAFSSGKKTSQHGVFFLLGCKTSIICLLVLSDFEKGKAPSKMPNAQGYILLI
jgi:hypothetical protein